MHIMAVEAAENLTFAHGIADTRAELRDPSIGDYANVRGALFIHGDAPRGKEHTRHRARRDSLKLQAGALLRSSVELELVVSGAAFGVTVLRW